MLLLLTVISSNTHIWGVHLHHQIRPWVTFYVKVINFTLILQTESRSYYMDNLTIDTNMKSFMWRPFAPSALINFGILSSKSLIFHTIICQKGLQLER